MWWRIRRSQFNEQKGAGNKRAMKKIVQKNISPGILAYVGDEPIGWCAFAPREEYPVLENSRVLKRVDDASVWSIVCFFVKKNYRKQGVTTALLQAAIARVKTYRGKILEGYPVDPKKSSMPDVFAYTGLMKSFLKAGFIEVARRSETRPIMRYTIGKKSYALRST